MSESNRPPAYELHTTLDGVEIRRVQVIGQFADRAEARQWMIDTTADRHARDALDLDATRAHARELRRCLDSTLGLLERVCERMPAGPDAFTLRAHLEGGAPETLHLIDQVITALGGPARDDDDALAKSFRRGYQVAALMTREEETGERDPAAWKEDPDAFWEREMAEAHHAG